MKKLILLLFIPLVFTCSSDSGDDNNNSILRDFLKENVFYYEYQGWINYGYEGFDSRYVVFDFQEQPYQQLSRLFSFSEYEGPACGPNDTTLVSDSYKCNEQWILGQIVEETNNKIVWQSQNHIQLEITKIDNQRILHTWINVNPGLEEPDVTGTLELQLSSFEELEEQLEDVGHTPQSCNTCTY